MDLLSAKRDAQVESKKLKKTVYVIVDDEGECTTSGAPLKGAIFAYTKGAESPLPPDAAKAASEKGKTSKPLTETKKQNNKTMATKKAAAKKATKKSAPKKSTGFDKNDKKTWGKKVNVSIKAMRDGLKKGFVYRDPQGVKQTEAYMSTRANQDFVREDMYLSGPF